MKCLNPKRELPAVNHQAGPRTLPQLAQQPFRLPLYLVFIWRQSGSLLHISSSPFQMLGTIPDLLSVGKHSFHIVCLDLDLVCDNESCRWVSYYSLR